MKYMLNHFRKFKHQLYSRGYEQLSSSQRAILDGSPIPVRISLLIYLCLERLTRPVFKRLRRVPGMMFGINTTMPRHAQIALIFLPFLLVGSFYLYTSYKRHLENPDDRIVPTPKQLAQGFWSTAAQPYRGELRLWVDSLASAKRFFIGVFLSATVGILLGLHMGVFPFFESLLLKFLTFFDKIPALALLPILFITFGVEEKAKIILIFIGITPTIALDTYLRAKEIPREQFVKALSLGASDFEVAYKVVLPQIFPKALDSVRLNLKAAWLFLIAAEAIAATAGLGFRIFLVRRYLAMNIIIPYVIWIGLAAYSVDFLLRWWVTHRYRWLYQ